MEESPSVTIRRTPAGFELTHWDNNAARILGMFLITDAPHSIEQLEQFVDSEQQQLLLPESLITKRDDRVVISHDEDRTVRTDLEVDRFIGIMQEWLFFLRNDAPQITIFLAAPEQQADVDPDKVYVAVGEYGGQKIIATRFPRAWSRDEIVAKVQEALERIVDQGDNQAMGVTKDGIVIQMYIKNNQVIAAFPAKLYNIR